jgi:integrase
MSRRSGQNGWIQKRNGNYDARFWIDVPGRSTRLCKRVRICPVDGPGSLNASERSRRLKQILVEFGANDEATARQALAANLGVTFQTQSELWLRSVQSRKRKPIKPHTAQTWQSHLRYINERIGALPLCDVNNLVLRELIAQMAESFSAKTITNYVGVVKMVVASAIDQSGEQIHPRKWNHNFIDLPLVTEQCTPTFTAAEIQNIIEKAEGQFALLYALLAGTGLRIGEALALKASDIDGSVVHVRHSLFNGALHSPKTKNGLREVDLHSSLAEALQAHLGGRSSGFVFLNEVGGSLHQSNVLRRSLHPTLEKMGRPVCGFHAFRRYRVTHLRKQRVPEDLLRFWIGHADKSITDVYSKVREDLEYRKFTAEQAGLGFTVAPELRLAPSRAQKNVLISAASA